VTTANQTERLLEELGEALSATVTFGHRHLGLDVWEPAAGSEAAAELASTESRADGSPWDEQVLRTAYAVANLLTTAVLDDLCSVQRLLGEPMPVIGVPVVARSAIEIGHRVWWLMESGIGARRRACRELVLSLTSARRAKQVARGFQAGPGVTEALGQEQRVLQRIADLGLATPTGGYSPSIEGETCPSATVGTAAMLIGAFPAGTSSEVVYRVYSAVMHGEIYGLMNFMAPRIQANGSTRLEWGLPGDVLDSTVQLAILAFREPYLRINHVMGWGKLERDLWANRLGKIFDSR
jgi:hypothetical protein